MMLKRQRLTWSAVITAAAKATTTINTQDSETEVMINISDATKRRETNEFNNNDTNEDKLPSLYLREVNDDT